MKAAIRREYSGPDGVEVAELPLPEPAKGEVRVRVAVAGVDASADHLMRGEPHLVRFELGRPQPRSPRFGTELAGTIDAVGEGVTGLAVGDRVFGVAQGSFADAVIASPAKLGILPAGVDFVDGAAAAVSGMTALDALRTLGPLAGRRVLVTGAGGGVGSFTVQLAVAAGAIVTGVCSTSKVELVRSLGASEVVDYTAGEPTGQFDAIVDTGGRRDLRVLRDLVVRGGTVALVGGEGGGGPLLGGFERQLLAPLRMLFSGRRFRSVMSTTTTRKLEELAAHLAAGDARAAIDRRYPLVEAAEAMRHFASGTVAGKLVLLP
jgi:NADPH:quinone reductase-like Zn-dependent oxidoreductase